jgi:sucrose-6F-phosphate phosphohydrolase
MGLAPSAEVRQILAMSDWCLITDIDGTLIGESESTTRLRSLVLRERDALARRGHRLHWVVATGRGLESTREVLLESGFGSNDFHALITSVGAELYLAGESSPDSAYRSHLAQSGFARRAVLDVLRELEFLRLQPEDEQLEHKVSYFAADGPDHRRRLHAALARLPFETKTVFAHDEYLDVVPVQGAKGGAVRHLLALWQIPCSRAVAAGDSGNDATMLEQDWHGIVVGNGRRQLGHLSSRSNVYFANEKHAAGVLEGLVALGFLAKAVLAAGEQG